MRFALTMPLLAYLAGPCLAQSESFNPYQAVLEAMPLEQAEPLIEALYGPIKPEDRFSGPGVPYAGGPILALLPRPSAAPAYFFLFCDEQLAAVSAPVSAAMAAAILEPLTPPGSNTTVYPNDGGVWLQTKDDTLMVDYRGVGTKQSMIVLTYPQQVFFEMDFAARCDEVAD